MGIPRCWLYEICSTKIPNQTSFMPPAHCPARKATHKLVEGSNAPSIQPYQNAQTVPGFMDRGKIVTRHTVSEPGGKHMQIEVLQQSERNATDRN